MSVVELLFGLALFALGLLRDSLSAQPHSIGLKQLLVIVAGALLAVDASFRLRRRSRAGLLGSLDEPGAVGRAATGALALALLGVTLFAFQRYVVDDSYITFRFARNALATGHPVWNPGERPVEGYSNFLWMAIAIAALRAHLSPLVVARALGILCLAASAPLVHRLAKRAGAGVPGARIAMLVFLATPAFAFWTMSGLETASVVLLVLGFLLALERAREAGRVPWVAAGAGALLVLSRPEAPLDLALLLLPLVASGRPGDRRVALLAAGLVAALSVPYVAWRYHEFGSLVPNTLVAKTRPLSGWPLVLDAFRFAFPFLLLAVPRLVENVTPLERQAWALLAGTGLAALNVQPHVAHDLRFFLPALAPVLAVSGVSVERMAGRVASERRRPAMAAIALALAADLLAPLFAMRTYAENEALGYERAHVPVGRLLAQAYGPSNVLAASDCGIVPYLSGMRTIDVWGLTDRRIAARGFDVGYVMAQHPDVVIAHSLYPHEFRGREAYDEGLYEAVQTDPSLRLRGRWGFFGYWLWVYSRRPLPVAAGEADAAPELPHAIIAAAP